MFIQLHHDHTRGDNNFWLSEDKDQAQIGHHIWLKLHKKSSDVCMLE